jgi:hypothetical protein
MAIKSNVSSAPIDLAAVSTDTTLVAAVLAPARLAITGLSIFNTTASTQLAVDIFESPDTTSAAGKKIASYTLDGNTSIDVVELIGQGLSSGRNIIGRQTTSGATSGQLNAKITVTQYTAGS